MKEVKKALSLYQKKEFKACITLCKQLLTINPQYPTTIDLLFACHMSVNDLNNAKHYALLGIKHHPSALAYNNLGLVYKKLEHWEESETCFKKAIDLDPHYVHSYTHLGSLFSNKMEYETAIEYHKKTLSLDDKHLEAYNNLGNLFSKLNRKKESREYYEKALTIDPNQSDVLFHLSLLYLSFDQYSKGFYLYRNRYNRNILFNLRREDKVLPHIQEAGNKTILIDQEQGYGDVIQFIRFLSVLDQYHPKKVLVTLDLRLMRLLSFNYPTVSFIPHNSSELFDYHFPIMDFGYLLQLEAKTSLYSKPYIAVKKEDSKQFLNDNFAPSNKEKIGVVFKGNSAHSNDKNRSIDLNEFIQNISFITQKCDVYSLQYDTTEEEKKILEENNIKAFQTITDFYDTALAIDNLDYIISVDTSVVHLSGAMGKTTFVLLPYDADWRWGLESNKTRWYDCLTLIRQRKLYKWDEVFVELKNHFQTIVLTQ